MKYYILLFITYTFHYSLFSFRFLNSLLFALTVGSLLSSVSLLIVLFRVSPLTAERPAVVSLFATLVLSICTLGSLALFYMWKRIPHHNWDDGKILSVSFRQSLFAATTVSTILTFHLSGILNWWIALMIVGVFVLIEAALHLWVQLQVASCKL